MTFTPTDAANYNPAVKADVAITVSKANPVTTWPTAAAITYGAALSTSALTGGINITPGTFAWTTGATIPTVTNTGYSVTFTPTDTGNYNTVVKADVAITVSKANPTVTWPTAAAITYGPTTALSTSALSGGSAMLGSTTVAGTFAWTTGATIPTVSNSGYGVTFTPTDTANYNNATGTVNITVNKAAGATVNAPTFGSKTANSITINAVTAPANGQQTVEYARNSNNTAPSGTWQDSMIFSGLNGGTTYYIFARAKESANYNAGAASTALEVTTPQSVAAGTFEYYWIDQHGDLVTTHNNEVTVNKNQTLTITAQGGSYDSIQWYLNGKLLAGESTATYEFTGTKVGKNTIGLFVEKDGKYYNTNIVITVK